MSKIGKPDIQNKYFRVVTNYIVTEPKVLTPQDLSTVFFESTRIASVDYGG
jgi:hypothetical protein